MVDAAQQSKQQQMSIGKACAYYLTGLVCLLVTFPLSMIATRAAKAAGLGPESLLFTLFINVFMYFAIGVYLSKKVLRELISWHPVWKTIRNVSSTKLSQLFFWPFSYPALFFRLAVVKYL